MRLRCAWMREGESTAVEGSVGAVVVCFLLSCTSTNTTILRNRRKPLPRSPSRKRRLFSRPPVPTRVLSSRHPNDHRQKRDIDGGDSASSSSVAVGEETTRPGGVGWQSSHARSPPLSASTCPRPHPTTTGGVNLVRVPNLTSCLPTPSGCHPIPHLPSFPRSRHRRHRRRPVDLAGAGVVGRCASRHGRRCTPRDRRGGDGLAV